MDAHIKSQSSHFIDFSFDKKVTTVYEWEAFDLSIAFGWRTKSYRCRQLIGWSEYSVRVNEMDAYPQMDYVDDLTILSLSQNYAFHDPNVFQ